MKPFTLALLAALAVGCSSAPDAGAISFPAASYASLSTDGGGLRIAVRTSPTQPPDRGLLSARLDITDANGAPQDGLTIAVEPWMAEMGHGASVTPTVEALGDGQYLVEQLALYMPGRWELRTTLGGAVDDHVVVDLDVR